MTLLTAERRLLLNAAVPHSIFQVRTASGDTRTFKVAERRHVTAPTTVELETRDDGTVPVIRGHAAVFDRESYDLGGFTEIVARGAFRRSLDDPARSGDCRCLFNHDPSMVLASTHNNTLDLREDPQGLHYYATPAETSYAEDVRALIRRGDVYQSSFGFTVLRDRWEEREDGTILRTILEIDQLYDVSPVTFPAYPQTDVSARDALHAIADAITDQIVESATADPEHMAGDEAVADDQRAREAALRELQSGAKRRLTLAKARSTTP